RTLNLSVNTPDLGVFTFDGVDATGNTYARTLLNGKTDSLVSHLIKLDSAYQDGMGGTRAITTADSLYFSFAYQAGGLADKPEEQDSLVLYFRDTTTVGGPRWVPVWRTTGAGLDPQRFYRALVSVSDVRYLHARFQFRFISYGSQNGVFDVWHLDQLRLYVGGTRLNPNPIPDLAISAVQAHVFGPYTRVSRYQYPAGYPQGSLLLEITGNQPATTTTTATGTLVFERNGSSQALGPNAVAVPADGVRATTGFSPTPQPLGSQADSLTFTLTLPMGAANNADTRRQNDQLVYRTGVDSVLALDDGEADSGFGLNTSFRQSFGQIFRLPAGSDTLRAVWLSFIPRFTIAAGKPLELVIWNRKANNPDSVLYKQIVSVNYGTAFSHYERYRLNRSILLPDSFILGLRQFDDVPINLGIDLNYDYNQGRNVLYDNEGKWAATSFAGTLMIRLEMNGAGYIPVSRRAAAGTAPAASLYPNPATQLQLYCPADCYYEVWDATGRMHLAGRGQQGVQLIAGTDSLAPGVYAVRVYMPNKASATQTLLKWIKP
ncbi:MAG: T9SS type A sorting domain-containing protein, partial [Sphingobacteriia bacterium]